MKQEIKDSVVGRAAKAMYKSRIIDGVICGRLLDFPVFKAMNEPISVEISWALAVKAVAGEAVIKL